MSDIVNYVFNFFFLVYALALYFSYIFIGILSAFELRFYENKNRYFNYKSILGYKKLPTISIIAPAYNEEKTIVQNIRSLLSLYYPEVEVIIVNDGSKDNTLQTIIEHYELNKVEMAVENKVKSARIRGIYKSFNSAYSNLIVLDKENGGKADALNAGINVSRSDLFLTIDVDCIIEQDAILRMVKPFLEEEGGRKVIASGGVVRIANSCEIKDGIILKVNYPKNIWAKFQVLEYFRAFTLGRMAWSKANGLLIISGAFGLFDRDIVVSAGGYDASSVGEDLELVVRMRRYMHENKINKYKVAFIPDPLCWTEVPSTFKILFRQRNRWTRGAIDTIRKHRKMFLNPKYGRIGMISFPYWVLFEWLAPILEFIGFIYFIIMVVLGRIDVEVFLIVILFVFSFSLAFSTFALFYESYIFKKYKGYKFIFQAIFVAMAEMIFYHPLNVLFSLSGNYDFFIKKNTKGWGVMTRTAFDSKSKKP
ncbi:MAG: glycosyltransferase [Bacteroidia bacterium]|nr:glycosyltransferase [Bacteroidia bacterium]